MKHKNVVMCILKNEDKILLLKREPNDDIYPGRWNFVCGTMEQDEKPLETAIREIGEESGITKDNLRLLKQGEPSTRADKDIGFTFYNNPFLFEANTNEVRLDHENTDYVWIKPDELLDYYLSPGTIQTAIKLLGQLPERNGILAIVYRNPDSFLLVETNNENVNFVAGGVEKNETEEDAVIREVEEESGIDVGKNRVKKLPMVNKFTYSKGFFEGINSTQSVFLVRVDEDVEIKFDGKEITEAKWMTKDEVRENLTFDHIKEIFEKSLEYL